MQDRVAVIRPAEGKVVGGSPILFNMGPVQVTLMAVIAFFSILGIACSGEASRIRRSGWLRMRGTIALENH